MNFVVKSFLLISLTFVNIFYVVQSELNTCANIHYNSPKILKCNTLCNIDIKFNITSAPFKEFNISRKEWNKTEEQLDRFTVGDANKPLQKTARCGSTLYIHYTDRENRRCWTKFMTVVGKTTLEKLDECCIRDNPCTIDVDWTNIRDANAIGDSTRIVVPILILIALHTNIEEASDSYEGQTFECKKDPGKPTTPSTPTTLQTSTLKGDYSTGGQVITYTTHHHTRVSSYHTSGEIITHSTPTPLENTTSKGQEPSKSSPINPAIIAGSVVPCVILLVVAGFILKKYRKKSTQPEEEIYASAGVVYAELDLKNINTNSNRPRLLVAESPYARIVGVLEAVK